MPTRNATAPVTTPPPARTARLESGNYQPHSEVRISRKQHHRIGSSFDVWTALQDVAGLDQEHFLAFDLNVRHRVIERRIVHIGTLTGVEIHPREVFRRAILNAAAAVVVAHYVVRNIMRLLFPVRLLVRQRFVR